MDAGESDRSRDILCRTGFHRIGARRRPPVIDPARGLRPRGLLADPIGIADIVQRAAAGVPLSVLRAGGEQRLDLDQIAADRLLEPVPGVWPRPIGIAWPHAQGHVQSRQGWVRLEAARGRRHSRHSRQFFGAAAFLPLRVFFLPSKRSGKRAVNEIADGEPEDFPHLDLNQTTRVPGLRRLWSEPDRPCSTLC